MSEPSKDLTIHTVLHETLSASSALHMNPNPISQAEIEARERAGLSNYLSETDGWAAHAVEHIRAAHHAAAEVYKALEAAHFALELCKIEGKGHARALAMVRAALGRDEEGNEEV